MSSFFKNWVITTVAVLIAAELVQGIHFTPGGLIIATLLLGILNAIVRPILIVLAFPVILLTMGLFLLVINALLLYWVGHMRNFHVDTFWDAFWGALMISVISMVLNWMFKTDREKVRRPTPPPPPRDTGKGPIIDV